MCLALQVVLGSTSRRMNFRICVDAFTVFVRLHLLFGLSSLVRSIMTCFSIATMSLFNAASIRDREFRCWRSKVGTWAEDQEES